MTDETHDLEGAESLSAGIGFLLWHAANSWQRAQRTALAGFDLTPVQLLLLAGLGELSVQDGNVVKQAALARHCRCDVMMTSQVVRGLEKRGLLVRAAHAGDARALAVRLTRLGKQQVIEASPVFAAIDERYFKAIAAERSAFAGALAALSGARQRVRIKAVAR